jgi:hypothetical protein
MLRIPVAAVPSQQFSVVVAGQQCQFSIYQKSTGLYFDLTVNRKSVANTRRIRDGVLMVRHAYLGVVGDFMMMDLRGTSDPEYSGLGTRYALVYVEVTD